MPIPTTTTPPKNTYQKAIEAAIDLGPNPIDPIYAYRAAVESSIDVISAILELCGNCSDYSSQFSVTLKGTVNASNKSFIDLKEVIVEDDGIGMDHAVMWERFRGGYYNSESHASVDKSGRNGVGVKTNLQYWTELRVETTTKGFIPGKNDWKCTEQNRDTIDETYRTLSKLKTGDPDTELRSYTMLLNKTIATAPWGTVPHDQSGTKVTLCKPRNTIIINTQILLTRLSHFVDFLDKIQHPTNSIKLITPNENGRMTATEVQAFTEYKRGETLAHIKGRSKAGMNIIFKSDYATKESKRVAPDTTSLGDIDIDVRLLEGSGDAGIPNEFVLSVCGANIYETSEQRRSNITPSLSFLIGQHNYHMSNGFGYRLHGCIKTRDEKLKKALRHNKSLLDLEDKHARAFLDYIRDYILVPLNNIYYESVNETSKSIDESIQALITQDLENILTRKAIKARIKEGEKKAPSTPSDCQNYEWKCNSCGVTWRAPIMEQPSCCSEFSGKDGCGSRDIERNSHEKNYAGQKNLRVALVDVLGNFLPARYEPNENTVYLATCHPVFVTDLKGTKKELHDQVVGVEQALFAIASYRSESNNKNVAEEFGELLRCWYETRNDAKKLKSICRSLWKEKGITIESV